MVAGLGKPRDIHTGWDRLGVSLEQSKMGSLHLSEPGLSHLKSGNDAFTKDCKAKETGCAGVLLMEKLSQIKR